MAIKKRTPVDPATAAKIEAFGAAADAPPVSAEPMAASAPATPSAATTAPKKNAGKASRSEEVAKTFLIRWPDAELPLLLAEVAELDERSQHALALRALRRGLEAIRAESGASK